jgi:hypothetical protein
MAIDVLSIPAMSADPERLFSSAKITIINRRNRLGIDAIEALECLKSWMGIKEWVEDYMEYQTMEEGGKRGGQEAEEALESQQKSVLG